MSKQNDLLASAKRHSIASSNTNSSDRTREAERKLADRRWEEAKKAGKR